MPPRLASRLIAPRAQRADVAAQVETLAGGPPSCARFPTTRARYRGPGRSRPCWPRRWAGPPAAGARPAPYAPLAPVTRTSGSSIKDEVRLPRRQQEAQARHAPLPSSPRCAPAPSAGPITSANKTRTKRLGPGRPRPGTPPIDTPIGAPPPTLSSQTTRIRVIYEENVIKRDNRPTTSPQSPPTQLTICEQTS